MICLEHLLQLKFQPTQSLQLATLLYIHIHVAGLVNKTKKTTDGFSICLKTNKTSKVTSGVGWYCAQNRWLFQAIIQSLSQSPSFKFKSVQFISLHPGAKNNTEFIRTCFVSSLRFRSASTNLGIASHANGDLKYAYSTDMYLYSALKCELSSRVATHKLNVTLAKRVLLGVQWRIRHHQANRQGAYRSLIKPWSDEVDYHFVTESPRCSGHAQTSLDDRCVVCNKANVS